MKPVKHANHMLSRPRLGLHSRVIHLPLQTLYIIMILHFFVVPQYLQSFGDVSYRTYVHIILAPYRLLSGHLLGKSCSHG